MYLVGRYLGMIYLLCRIGRANTGRYLLEQSVFALDLVCDFITPYSNILHHYVGAYTFRHQYLVSNVRTYNILFILYLQLSNPLYWLKLKRSFRAVCPNNQPRSGLFVYDILSSDPQLVLQAHVHLYSLRTGTPNILQVCSENTSCQQSFQQEPVDLGVNGPKITPYPYLTPVTYGHHIFTENVHFLLK